MTWNELRSLKPRATVFLAEHTIAGSLVERQFVLKVATAEDFPRYLGCSERVGRRRSEFWP